MALDFNELERSAEWDAFCMKYSAYVPSTNKLLVFTLLMLLITIALAIYVIKFQNNKLNQQRISNDVRKQRQLISGFLGLGIFIILEILILVFFMQEKNVNCMAYLQLMNNYELSVALWTSYAMFGAFALLFLLQSTIINNNLLKANIGNLDESKRESVKLFQRIAVICWIAGALVIQLLAKPSNQAELSEVLNNPIASFLGGIFIQLITLPLIYFYAGNKSAEYFINEKINFTK